VESGHDEFVSADGAATDDRIQRHKQGSLVPQGRLRHSQG
jgi:hypothetical protein